MHMSEYLSITASNLWDNSDTVTNTTQSLPSYGTYDATQLQGHLVVPNDDPTHDALVNFAHQLADASSAAILPHFRSQLSVDNKAQEGRFDPVTVADRAAETAIRQLIESTHPEHGILGEEHGSTASQGPYRWVVDPIDGTRAFIIGLPTWGTLIGLEINERPTIGLMNQPYTGDRFWSDGNTSSYRSTDGTTRRIKSRTGVRLENAQMASTDPTMFRDDHDRATFDTLRSRATGCRFGTDCYAYALLAAGFIDLVVEAGLQPYDIVALIPIIENAGGVITTWDGGDPRHGGRILAAGSAALHSEALELIA